MARLRLVLLGVLMSMRFLTGVAWTAPGDLDPTFGVAGVATTPVGGGAAYALAIQPDGKIVAAGAGFFSTRFAVARYLSTGALDPAFAGGSVLITLPPGAMSGIARSVAVQPDGKIVVAGEVTDPSGAPALGVIRLLSDGQPDPTFGGTGGVVTGGGLAGGRSIALQPDGGIVVAGKVGTPVPRFALVRYLGGGTIDPSFGTGGIASTVFDATKESEFTAVLRQPDGSLLAAGPAVLRDNGIPPLFGLTRWSATGTLDPTFGGGLVTAFSVYPQWTSLARQNDGKIVVQSGWDVFRFDAGGTPDLQFGVNGSEPIWFATPGRDVTSLALQPGRILVAGGGNVPAVNVFYLSRIQPNGLADPTMLFEFYELGATDEIAYAAAMQADGRFLILGGRSDRSFALVRVDASGCGDGLPDAGEQCDDGNFASGDGCDVNCTLTACGNGIITAGETCDDGNTNDADCCSATCQPRPAGTPCADDDYQCTIDTCTSYGTCDHVFQNGASCDDGCAATSGDVCQYTFAGPLCAGIPFPPPPSCIGATTTTPTSTTTSTTLPHLLVGTKLGLKDDPEVDRRKLAVVSKDASIDLGAGNGTVDDPRVTGATLRVATAAGAAFDDTYLLAAQNWSLIGNEGENRGYKYKDELLVASPVKSAMIRAGRLVKVAGKGGALGHVLASDPNPVAVTLGLGRVRYCMRFGGATKFVAGKTYSAKNAPPPVDCAP